MVFADSDIVVFPLSSNESVFGTITSEEEREGMLRDLQRREGPLGGCGSEAVKAQEAMLVCSENIKSENSLTMLDFMEGINKESSHVSSEPLTLPSQQALQ